VRPDFVADAGVVARAAVFGALIGVAPLASAGAFAQQNAILPPVTVTCTNSSSDVAEINNALSSGGDIQIAPGTCQVGGSSIIISQSNTWLYGSGVGVTILQLPSQSSFSSAIIQASGSLTNIRISNLQIDGYDNTAAHAANIFIQGVTGVSVDHIAITRMYGYFGVALQGVTNFNVSDNQCTLTTARTTQNECIITTQALQNQNGSINENGIVNSGMEIDGENIQIAGNDISGWNFGGGITMGPAPYGSVTTSTFQNCIVNNKVHNSGLGPDSNSDYPNGLEIWSYNTTVGHNTTWNNAAAGIYVGGENDVIVGNVTHDNGQNKASTTGLSGIFIQYYANTVPSTFGANAIISGNSSWNTNASSGPQNYALDINSSVTGVMLGANNFGAGTSGTVAGPYNYGGNSGALTHDFNGDCKSDIIWRDTSGNLAIWEMNGPSILNPSMSFFGNVPTNWWIVGQHDFNGDGNADLLWRDSGGNLYMWFMNGSTLSSSTAVANIPANWTVMGTADMNGDGIGDLLLQDTAGDLSIWFMNGSTISSTVSLGNVPPSSGWSIVGETTGTVLWRNSSSGDLALWLVNGSTVQSVSLGTITSNWIVQGVGDFNGDGIPDILLRDSNTGTVAMWFLNSTGGIQSVGTVGAVPSNWHIVQTGDYNGDGYSDILWIDTGGDVAAWFMNGSTISSSAGYGNVRTTWQVQALNAE
jgi:hypothetical protein